MALLATAAVCTPIDVAFGDDLVITLIDSPAQMGTAEPNLVSHEGGAYLSWLRELPDGGHALEWSRWDGESWSTPGVVHTSTDMFANWADFPSLLALSDGTLVAHWLQKSGDGVYDYDVWTRISQDGGASWSTPARPYRDTSLGEHGFVSLVKLGESRFGVFWLDGRQFGADSDTHEMALMYTEYDGSGFRPETFLDRRVCDCCQTTAASTSDGLFVAYRDRSEGEVRDISYMRRIGGQWTEPRTLHPDGWEIPACPVNGPSAAVQDRAIGVAWFGLSDEQGHVRVVVSEDGGRSFSKAVRVDGGHPLGRVDIEWISEGVALASWVERIEDGRAEVRVRTVQTDLSMGPEHVVARTSASRSSGFPRMTRAGEAVLLTWTDADAKRVRVAKVVP